MTVYTIPSGLNIEALQSTILSSGLMANHSFMFNQSAIPITVLILPDLTVAETSTLNSIISMMQNAPAAQAAALAAWNTLPPYLQSGTVDQFTAFVDNQVFNGQTIAQVTATINSTVVNITTANVAQINAQLGNIRTMLIAAATAIIGIREILKATGKLVIVIRDFTVRFTKFMLGIFGFR